MTRQRQMPSLRMRWPAMQRRGRRDFPRHAPTAIILAVTASVLVACGGNRATEISQIPSSQSSTEPNSEAASDVIQLNDSDHRLLETMPTPQDDLGLLAAASSLDDARTLSNALNFGADRLSVDFSAQILVAFSTSSNSCVPSFVGFSSRPGRVLVPVLKPPALQQDQGCEDLIVWTTYVVAIDRLSVGSWFVLEVPGLPDQATRSLVVRA